MHAPKKCGDGELLSKPFKQTTIDRTREGEEVDLGCPAS